MSTHALIVEIELNIARRDALGVVRTAQQQLCHEQRPIRLRWANVPGRRVFRILGDYVHITKYTNVAQESLCEKIGSP